MMWRDEQGYPVATPPGEQRRSGRTEQWKRSPESAWLELAAWNCEWRRCVTRLHVGLRPVGVRSVAELQCGRGR